MSNLLPVYTQTFPVSSNTLITEFFSKVVGKITIPNFASRPTPKTLRNTIKAMEEELVIWEKEISKRYAFENLTEEDLNRISYLNKTIHHYRMALYGYDELIDMSFLAEQRGNFPYFGIIDTFSKGMRLSARKQSRISDDIIYSSRPDIPTDLLSYYQVTFQWLASQFNYGEGGEVYIASFPSGKMHKELSQRLDVSLRSGLFDGGIFVVFQADWELNKDTVIKRDPLIIGRKLTHSNGPMHYLIGMYDPTPMEEWVAVQHVNSLRK